MAGGALGSLARYLLSAWAAPISAHLPWGTVLINASGSLLIGFFGALTLTGGRFPASDNLRLFVMIGICGGYTTFSSFSLQTFDLLRSGGVLRAAINVAASVLLCVAAVGLGQWTASHFSPGPQIVAQSSIEEEV